MSTRIEVITGTDLARERWQFFYNERTHQLTCCGWYRESRPTKRHHFTGEESFDPYYSRKSSARPDIPPDVAKLAIEKFLEGLTVGHLKP